MGFPKGDKYKDTPQTRWEARENAALEKICNDYVIEVHHPMRGKALAELCTAQLAVR
jgi:hypothetical protein